VTAVAEIAALHENVIWAVGRAPLAILSKLLIGGCRMADSPSLFDQFEQWYANCRDNEALDHKTKALIGIAVVLIGNCEPCTVRRISGAKRAGATDAEIDATLAWTMAIRAGMVQSLYRRAERQHTHG
jgi:AhpD family alkylhydroperoxidase